jgi:hypothetical protein
MSVGPTKGHVAFCWKPTQHRRVKLKLKRGQVKRREKKKKKK